MIGIEPTLRVVSTMRPSTRRVAFTIRPCKSLIYLANSRSHQSVSGVRPCLMSVEEKKVLDLLTLPVIN